jgi:YVTN family beta-propeller protein
MSGVKQDVKDSVKVYTRTFVSYLVKESTKKMVKSLTRVQKKMLESRVRNMSDDQLEEYFDKDLYFRSELENTVKTVSGVQKAKSGPLLENLQAVCEASCIQNLIKALIQPVTKMALAAGAGIALLALVSISMLIIGGSNDADQQFPVANFSSNAAGLSVKFTDQSENAEKWKWDFGDGTGSTEQNPAHIYSAAGNYTVSLTVSNKKDTDSISFALNVSESQIESQAPIPDSSLLPLVKSLSPVANLVSNVTRGYAPLSVQFTDTSENTAEWDWDFGDGTGSTEQSPVHTYHEAGNYTVRLTVKTEEGTGSKTASINVFQRLVYAYVTNSGDNTVSVIDTASNAVTDTIPAGNSPYEISASPEGKKIYVANWGSGTVSVIDTSENNVTATVDTGASPGGVAVSPDGTALYVTNVVNNTVSVIDTSLNSVTATVNIGNYPAGIAVSPDGKRVYVTNTGSIEAPGNSVYVISTLDYSIEAVSVGRGPSGVAVTPDEKKVYVSNSDDGTVSVIDTATNTAAATVNVGNSSWGVAVNPAGTEVYVANVGDIESNLDGYVSVIDTAADRVIATVPAGKEPYKVAVSPDGTQVYVTNKGSNTVSIIDTATKEVLDTVTVGSKPWGVAFVSR